MFGNMAASTAFGERAFTVNLVKGDDMTTGKERKLK